MVATGRIELTRASAGEDRGTAQGARGDRRTRTITRWAAALGRLVAGGIATPALAARVAARTLVAARSAAARAAVPAVRSLVIAGALAAPALLLSASGADAEPAVQPGARLTGEGEIGEAKFGRGAALSANGEIALVGGQEDANGIGAAWVYMRSGSSWSQQVKLTAPEEVGAGHFGHSVALSADGDTALVAAPTNRNRKGAVWVFTRSVTPSGSTWTEQAELTAGEEHGEARFGRSVALSADGDTAMIGGPFDENGVGAVWVFTRSGSAWTQEGAKLTGKGEQGEGRFGSSVALSAEAETALIGGPTDEGRGAAWVFTRSGSAWTQEGAKLTGEGEQGEGQFGSSVALSAEGETALIGGPSDDEGAGAAWVFTRGLGSTFTAQGAKLTATGVETERDFGSSVALSAPGDAALIGAAATDRRWGGAWLFTRADAEWERAGFYLTPGGEAEAPDEIGETQFGRSVALSGDGETALVGGPGTEEKTGAAWVFEGAPVLHEPPEEEKTKTVGKHNPPPPPPPPPPPGESSSPQTGQTPKTEVLAVKALQPVAATATCKLVGSHLMVNRTGHVPVKLACSGNHGASGKLTLTVTKHVKKTSAGKSAAKAKTITKTITIAGGTFAIAPNKTVTVTLLLTKTGRALLGAGHGHLTIAARLAKLLPTPAQTHTATVQLSLQKPAAKKTGKK